MNLTILRSMLNGSRFALGALVLVFGLVTQVLNAQMLQLNELDYYEKPGVNVLVFSNWYNDNFSDSKISGVELIHHGVRTATNGDVRLLPTPEQWDRIPTFIRREIDPVTQKITAWLEYPEFQFSIETVPFEAGFRLSVHLEEALPEEMKGKAGFNLEFLPSSYFGKSYLMDAGSGILPLHPAGPTEKLANGYTQPLPLKEGRHLVLAPEDTYRRVQIKSETGFLSLYDGRNKAQNGWLVVRELLPAGQKGKVLEWFVEPAAVENWKREPVISFSQVGYHPTQVKRAVVELDARDELEVEARLYRLLADGSRSLVKVLTVNDWGRYKRYHYGVVDFSEVDSPGLYMLRYGEQEVGPLRVDEAVYADAWHLTLDVFMPVQMDHMFVREAYRVWHGEAHRDDALQAPTDHRHFDLFGQGPTTDTPFEPFEHIPGLDVGGWFDAGDFDLRTQTHYYTILYLAQAWEDFRIERDETYICQDSRYTELRRPDGKPDLLQQIEHGILALMAQYDVFGRAIPGLIVPELKQYTHLGDAINITDNLIYRSDLDSLETDGAYSGKRDDRWAFTSKSTPLNYGSASALAAASRALKGYNDSLATVCLATATEVWTYEQLKEPDIFYVGNTTGGPLLLEEMRATVQLLKSSGDAVYAQHLVKKWPEIEESFEMVMGTVVHALPFMDETFVRDFELRAKKYVRALKEGEKANPFGVHISEGGWAGNGGIIGRAIDHYWLIRAFPGIMDADYVHRGLHFLYGTHPDSNISFVSGVGAHSKRVAYGMNRADYSFIPGGIVPGVLILNPDFPENKEDWPFLWGENEYVVNLGASYLYLVHAAMDLLEP